jgi:hypothetical protein
MSVISELRRPKQEDLKFEATLGYRERPYLTKTKTGTGSEAQAVERLLWKLKAMSSNPSSTK